VTARVVVVGGGVAGLATAWLVRELAREQSRPVAVTVLEGSPHHGGATRTDRVDGYVCEWGPNGFLDNEPATLDLVDRLGLREQLVAADQAASNRYIYHGGKMRLVPVKPPAFLASDILPWPAKLRMAMEAVIPARRDGADETIDAFGRRRLGSAFAQLMLDPMVSGIFAGDTKHLSLKATFPKMEAMEREYGGLFRALIGKKREARRTGQESGGPAGPGAVLHTFVGGMGQLTDTLAGRLRDALLLETPATRVETRDEGFRVLGPDGRYWDCDAVVLACPSYAAAPLVADLAPAAAEAAAGIWHAPVDVVCHGHPQAHLTHPLNGFGVLIPRSEGVRILGSLWSDAIFPGQAPGGRRLLRSILGGAHDPEILSLEPAEVHATAQRDHETVMGIRGEPEFRRHFRHPQGIAQYTVGHLDRVAVTEALETDLPGIFFTGASYRGVSVNGSVKDAFRVARSVLDLAAVRS